MTLSRHLRGVGPAARATLLLAVATAVVTPLAAQDEALARRASDARMKGAEDAPVTVFELADFECPFCRRFTDEILPLLDSAYISTGKVRWIYVNYPLPNHPRAWAAAEAAMCIGSAGGDFWRAHDEFFVKQAAWANGGDPAAIFLAIAQAAGADQAIWQRCVDDDLVAPVLVQDLMSAAQTGATGTPAFIINQRDLFVGVRPFDDWVAVLDAALEQAAADGEEAGGDQ